MTSNKDIRCVQRFSNFKKAFSKLENIVLQIQQKQSESSIEDIVKEGVIQRFEYTHELAWNVMKDFLEEKGKNEIYGSKDATREAFESGLITNGEVWMDMIRSRNQTSHTYNETTADSIFFKIINEYYPEFLMFKNKMERFIENKN
ncbi:MAG: nucleotidyltransferase [Bacteroidia bacterium]|nr:MAG: nucleotidyltransferase [Bacteroidia bacterium]